MSRAQLKGAGSEEVEVGASLLAAPGSVSTTDQVEREIAFKRRQQGHVQVRRRGTTGGEQPGVAL